MAAANVLPFPPPAPKKRAAADIRRSAEATREAEATAKRNVDRVDRVLTRLEERVETYDAQIKALQKAKAIACGRIDRIETRTLEQMRAERVEKYAGNRTTLAVRPNPVSLQVVDLDKIPAEYVRTKTTREADKVAIKVMLARGEDIAGVKLVQTLSLKRD